MGVPQNRWFVIEHLKIAWTPSTWCAHGVSSASQHKGHADRVGSPDNLLYTHLKGCQRSLPSTAFHEYATSCVDNYWQCGRKRLDSNCFESRLKITKVQTRLVLAKDRNDGTRREKHANTQSVCPWCLKPHTRAKSFIPTELGWDLVLTASACW